MLTLNTIRLVSLVISNALSLFLISSQAPHTFSDSALMSVFFGLLYIIYKGELNDTKAYRGNYIQHSVSIYGMIYNIT